MSIEVYKTFAVLILASVATAALAQQRQAPWGRDVAASHHDRVYAAEQFSNTVSVTDPNVSIIDTDSFWIDGYFEETKMARVCTGAPVEAKLMGYSAPIVGHVSTITRGLSVSNAAAGAQGLPNVDPIYTWVRLAQRVPVRIAIDEVPPGVPLVSGMTATVSIRDTAPNHSTWLKSARESLSNVLDGPSARPDCIPTEMADDELAQSVPEWEAQAAPEPDQINPGLASSIQAPPGHD